MSRVYNKGGRELYIGAGDREWDWRQQNAGADSEPKSEAYIGTGWQPNLPASE